MNAETMNPMDNLIRKMNLSTLSIPSVHITVIIDIIIVAIVIYTVIHWIKETRAWSLFRGLMVIALFSLLSYNLHFYTITWIIERTFSVGVIAVIIIFQPELRKALEQIGASGFSSVTGLLQTKSSDDRLSPQDANEIAEACVKMAEVKTGALIVIERNVSMGDIVSASGVAVDAVISSQLLINIFEDKTPLHDGAVIIRDNRVAAASCILPVTQSEIGQELGTRHRAAVGASEVSDAFIIVVSEETGKISIARDGKLEKAVSEAVFRQELLNLCEKTAPAGAKAINKIWRGMSRHDK